MRAFIWAITTFPLFFVVACGGGPGNKQSEQQQTAALTVQALIPSTAPAGSADLKVQITGSGFMAATSVQWAGAAKNCSFVSNSALSCVVTAADLSLPGSANISVTNPAPGGGSATATFVIGAPNAPSLTSISPSSIAPGSGDFTVTANGSGFTRNSTVLWNGSARQSTYVSNLQLTARIGAADFASGGTFPISVSTPSPGGGVSQAVNASVQYPLPTISSLSPSGIAILGPGFTLTVNGTNFYPGALVSWNHLTRATTFVSATQLTASILTADLNVASATTANVYVTNPSPSAGISNTVQFTMVNPVPTISAISPDSGLAGDRFDIHITGTGFVRGATVQAAGRDWSTLYLDSTDLQAGVLLGEVGSIGLTITNPAPTAGASNVVQIELKAVGNPMNPQLVTIDPAGQPVPSEGLGVSGPGRYISFRGKQNLMRDTCLGIASECSPSTAPFASGLAAALSFPSENGRFVGFSSVDTLGIGGIASADLCTGVPGCNPWVTSAPYWTRCCMTRITTVSASGRYVPFAVPGGMGDEGGIGIYDFCSSAPPGCTPGLISLGDSSTSIQAVPVISRDARYAVFAAGWDSGSGIALGDTCIGAAPGCVPMTTRLTESNSGCSVAAISRNAAYVAYFCNDGEIQVANTCIEGVLGCSTAPIAAVPNAGYTIHSAWDSRAIWISDSGRYVASMGYSPSQSLGTVWISDTCIGASSGCQPQTAFACLNSQGALANAYCKLDGLSDDGKYIYFDSAATDLAAGVGGQSYGYVVANPLQ